MGIKLRKYFKQWMIYWAKNGSDKNGQSKFAAPEPRRCRWDDGATMMVMPDMRLVTFSAHIMADQDIEDGSLLLKVPYAVTAAVRGQEEKAAAAMAWFKATFKIQYPMVPTVKEGARESKQIRRLGDIRARPFFFEVFLG